MIGIAFSLGFTVGPLMGAYFALTSRTTGSVFYQTPALLALAFSVADLLFIWVVMPETLTKDVKVSYGNIHTCRLMIRISFTQAADLFFVQLVVRDLDEKFGIALECLLSKCEA